MAFRGSEVLKGNLSSYKPIPFEVKREANGESNFGSIIKNKCQIFFLNDLSEDLSIHEILWQRRNRLKRIIKRRWNFIKNQFKSILEMLNVKKRAEEIKQTQNRLNAGDLVFVKSKEEIQKTLNKWNQLKGCAFMEEMWPYCGTKQKVFKRIEKFLDERDYLIKKCNGIIILENVMCQGTKDFGPCDRSCFFFWREEWLQRI